MFEMLNFVIQKNFQIFSQIITNNIKISIEDKNIENDHEIGNFHESGDVD